MSLVYVAPNSKSSHNQARVHSAGFIKTLAREVPRESKDPLYEWLNLPPGVTSRIPDGYNGPLYKFYGDYEKYAESLCESPEEIYARWMGSSRKIIEAACRLADGNPRYEELSAEQTTPVIAKSANVLPNGRTKVSAHVVYPRILATTDSMKKARELAVHHGYVSKDDAPDIKAYNPSQKMRLPLFPKSSDDRRILVPGEDDDYEDHIISYLNREDRVVIDAESAPEVRGRPRSRNAARAQEASDNAERAALELARLCGFPAPVMVSKRAGEGDGPSFYEFQDEEAMRACPLCHGTHDSNNNYVLKVSGRRCFLTRHTENCEEVDVHEFVSAPTKIVMDAFDNNIGLAMYHAQAIRKRFDLAGMRYLVLRDGEKVQWWKWRGNHWGEDSTDLDHDIRVVMSPDSDFGKDKRMSECIKALCAASDDKPYLCSVVRECESQISHPKLSTLKKELASHLTVSAGKEEVFDVHDHLLHFPNGYLDLDDYDEVRGRFAFHAPDPEKRNSRMCGVDYAEDYDEGRMRRVDELLELWVPDAECRDYLLRFFSCMLSGDQDVKAFLVMTDSVDAGTGHVGSNGKSKCLKLLSSVLGAGDEGYACTLSPGTFEQNTTNQANAHTANIASVPGRRMVYVDEMSKEKALSKENVKNWTSGTSDLYPVRQVYQPMRYMRWKAKIVFACNNMQFPRFEEDPALMARMLMVPFENRFVNDERLVREDQEQVRHNPGHRRSYFMMDARLEEELAHLRLEFLHKLLAYFPGKRDFVRRVTGSKPQRMEFYLQYLQLDNNQSMKEFLDARLENFQPPSNTRKAHRESVTLAALANCWKEHSGFKGASYKVQPKYVRSCLETWLRAHGFAPGLVLRVRDTSHQATDQTPASRVTIFGFRLAKTEEPSALGGDDDDGVDRVDFFGDGARQVFLEDFGPTPKRSRTEV